MIFDQNSIDKQIDARILRDEKILEDFLEKSYTQSDVKELSKMLINKFGNLDNVLMSDIDALINFEGISEKTAILISLVNLIRTRMQINENTNITNFSDYTVRKFYAKNIFSFCRNEVFVLVTLDENMRIISDKVLSEGVANSVEISPVKMIETVLYDGAKNAVIMHNHPFGPAIASTQDYYLTLKVKKALGDVGVKLIDHIIVGEKEEFSMACDGNVDLFKN